MELFELDRKKLENLLGQDRDVARLKKVLHRWQSLVSQYTRDVSIENGDPDAPYWFTERANVGLLSAASWTMGVPALEAFGDATKVRKRGGRVDLWLHVPPDADGLAIEAKHVWAWPCNSQKTIRGRIEDSLVEAVKDTEKRKAFPRCLGVSFVVPKNDPRDENWLLTDFFGGVANVQSDLRVWAPAATGQPCPTLDGHEFPGVLLLARVP